MPNNGYKRLQIPFWVLTMTTSPATTTVTADNRSERNSNTRPRLPCGVRCTHAQLTTHISFSRSARRRCERHQRLSRQQPTHDRAFRGATFPNGGMVVVVFLWVCVWLRLVCLFVCCLLVLRWSVVHQPKFESSIVATQTSNCADSITSAIT